MTRAEWESTAESRDLPRYRGRQIFDSLHLRGVRDFSAMRELPLALRESLARDFPIELPTIVRRDDAADGSRKYGLRLADGALVEAVFMPGERSLSAVNEFEDARASRQAPGLPAGSSALRAPATAIPDRYTVCLSSQTGCAVDCAFCVTGRLGGGRNLTAGEIVGQLDAVLADAGLDSRGLRVVFMGMGEPFLNPEGVIPALAILFERISPRRVTVSTSGITPAFQRFAGLERRPNLAVSINAADEGTRTRLMPITRTYPLAGLVEALREWPLESRRRITVEYVLIAGMNDSLRDARTLARLLAGIPVKVNVIPLNEDPVYLPGWARPSEATIDAFARSLSASGLTVTVRRSRGPDASAACGQLKGRTEDVRRR